MIYINLYYVDLTDRNGSAEDDRDDAPTEKAQLIIKWKSGRNITWFSGDYQLIFTRA